MNLWCNQIVSGLHLFLYNKGTYLVVSVIKIVSPGFCTASPVIAQPSEAFHEAHCLKRVKWVPRFCMNHGDIKSRKKSHRATSVKYGGCGMAVVLFITRNSVIDKTE